MEESPKPTYSYEASKREMKPNPACIIKRSGGKTCDPNGGDPSQRCGPCRTYVARGKRK